MQSYFWSGQWGPLHIASTLLKEKLIACANILSPISSVYEWEGQVCEENELGVFLKTCSTKYDELEDRIKTLHSYDVPCIIQLPIQNGNQDFLSWISKQVTPN
ncbi:MAG: divalent-cation tolerance protein CutA [Oligoflexales bacterium]|nr:divalent-cation tolerance protein CutA [Oligoflexales bacterium]